MPEGITLNVWQDQSQVPADRLAILLNNGAAGFFVVLTLFLEMRLAFWVSFGIPHVVPGRRPDADPGRDHQHGLVLRVILVLGILVDDAIRVDIHFGGRVRCTGSRLEGTLLEEWLRSFETAPRSAVDKANEPRRKT